MTTQCSSYPTEAEAREAVVRLLAGGTPGTRVSVLCSRPLEDHRGDHVGAYAGDASAVGGFAGTASSTADAMGGFAPAAEGRRGGFGDIDRDQVVTYEDGVRRVHVASHRELERRLSDAGLDDDAVAADVAALHAGRVLVLVDAA